jgi:hypothetical protein
VPTLTPISGNFFPNEVLVELQNFSVLLTLWSGDARLRHRWRDECVRPHTVAAPEQIRGFSQPLVAVEATDVFVGVDVGGARP